MRTAPMLFVVQEKRGAERCRQMCYTYKGSVKVEEGGDLFLKLYVEYCKLHESHIDLA